MHTVYIDASSSCNTLSFIIGSTSTMARSWSIKATQLSCDYVNLAPPGCDQWYFGSASQPVRSFNWNDGQGHHLAYQNQAICVRWMKTVLLYWYSMKQLYFRMHCRRERDTCRICWYTATPRDFDLSGETITNYVLLWKIGLHNNWTVFLLACTGSSANLAFNNPACCGYGPAGGSGSGFDCVQIPSAHTEANNNLNSEGDRFCGRFGLTTARSTSSSDNTVSICCEYTIGTAFSDRLPMLDRCL